MIDPKLNEIPADTKGDFANRPESNLTDEERAIREKQVRAGYSVNDSIAAGTTMSDGGRGVDVSGVKTGSGAGAGTVNVTPPRPGDSSNTEIQGGERGVGLNYRDSPDYRENK